MELKCDAENAAAQTRYVKQLITEVAPYVKLYRDTRTGIAWVANGTVGLGHSCHPNIDASGSVRGMKARGYWRKDDRTVRSHGFQTFNWCCSAGSPLSPLRTKIFPRRLAHGLAFFRFAALIFPGAARQFPALLWVMLQSSSCANSCA